MTKDVRRAINNLVPGIGLQRMDTVEAEDHELSLLLQAEQIRLLTSIDHTVRFFKDLLIALLALGVVSGIIAFFILR